jgi:hypothetical protein
MAHLLNECMRVCECVCVCVWCGVIQRKQEKLEVRFPRAEASYNEKSLTFGTGVLYLIQINHQPDATVFQFIILTFVYSSTYFGRFPAHHQELNDCSDSL